MSTFNAPPDIDPITLAKSSDINAIKSATAAAFALLPHEDAIKKGKVNYAVDTGSVNSYAVALSNTINAYDDGLLVSFRPNNSNTGAATINVNSLGEKSIRLTGGEALTAGDINKDVPIDVRYSSATGFFHLAPNSAVRSTIATEQAAIAKTKANEASTSASGALNSKNAAASSAIDASTSAASAATSASTATTKASEASTSASGAASSASAANISASNAASSASSASSSANAAATSANAASASASSAATSASNAATSETNAANYASAINATAAVSYAIGTGSKTFGVGTGKQFQSGQFVTVSDASNPANYLYGSVTSYSGGVLTVNVTSTGGSGTVSTWNISLSGIKGDKGDSSDLTTSIISTSSSAASMTRSLLDTSAGAITITLPASPVTNDIVEFADYSGTWAANNATINPNGNKMLGSIQNLILNVNNGVVRLIYSGATKGWINA